MICAEVMTGGYDRKAVFTLLTGVVNEAHFYSESPEP